MRRAFKIYLNLLKNLKEMLIKINPLSLPLEVMRMLFGVEHTQETCQIWWNMKANKRRLREDILLLYRHLITNAKVIALSPKTLMATNMYICEVCNKEFQREQNLQQHITGHNLPWKLRRHKRA
ncbi:protein indeterminate-domain 5, chloroplastic [Trifolium repens]|nr:protein indeterminate-domain 5, chloroplastic [Trifolium repens]